MKNQRFLQTKEEIQDLGQEIANQEMKDHPKMMKIIDMVVEGEEIRAQDQGLMIIVDTEGQMKEDAEIPGQNLIREIEKDLMQKEETLEKGNIEEMNQEVDLMREIEDHINKEKYLSVLVKYIKALLRKLKTLDSLF